MNELNPKESYDPTFLFIRADERTEAVEITVKDMDKEVQHIREDIINFRHHFEERVEKGVAQTGQRNSKEISDLETRIAVVENEIKNLKTQLFDKDTGLIDQFKSMREWQSNFNKVIVGFIITGCAGGLILWAVKNFH